MSNPVNFINKNSKTAYIFAWQEFLSNHNFTKVGTPDGAWGPNTTHATKDFQRSAHIGVDGRVGRGTLAAANAKGFRFPVIQNFEIAGQSNTVIDISKYQKFSDRVHDRISFDAAYDDGIRAVIQKCSQNLSEDPTYGGRVHKAKEANILWGAYHFAGAGDGAAQARYFLGKVEEYGGSAVLALDWESSKSTGLMSAAEAVDFVQTIADKTGKYPILYTRADIVANANPTSSQLEVLTKCPLWVAAYLWKSKTPKLPKGWNEYTLWQFSDGTHGHGALAVDGIGICDRDMFNGTEEELNAFWQNNEYNTGHLA